MDDETRRHKSNFCHSLHVRITPISQFRLTKDDCPNGVRQHYGNGRIFPLTKSLILWNTDCSIFAPWSGGEKNLILVTSTSSCSQFLKLFAPFSSSCTIRIAWFHGVCERERELARVKDLEKENEWKVFIIIQWRRPIKSSQSSAERCRNG